MKKIKTALKVLKTRKNIILQTIREKQNGIARNLQAKELEEIEAERQKLKARKNKMKNEDKERAKKLVEMRLLEMRRKSIETSILKDQQGKANFNQRDELVEIEVRSVKLIDELNKWEK